MGNDGGTIPSRREILNFNSRNKTSSIKNKNKNLNSSNGSIEISNENYSNLILNYLNDWKYCKLSKKLLDFPILSDYKGQLYNKEEILKFLLNKDYEISKYKEFSHIRSLRKDLVELNLNDSDDANNNYISFKDNVLNFKISDTIIDFNKFDISDLKFNDINNSTKIIDDSINNNTKKNSNFFLQNIVYISPCGCLINSNFLNELINFEKSRLNIKKNSSKDIKIDMNCPICSKSFNTLNIIPINKYGFGNEIKSFLDNRLLELNNLGLSHSLKELKVTKKRKKFIDENEKDNNNNNNNQNSIKKLKNR
ncbi:unnamed protein product [[Candida] boidinii]|nr:unnamed protein product [[Candida] boidinii]